MHQKQIKNACAYILVICKSLSDNIIKYNIIHSLNILESKHIYLRCKKVCEVKIGKLILII